MGVGDEMIAEQNPGATSFLEIDENNLQPKSEWVYAMHEGLFEHLV